MPQSHKLSESEDLDAIGEWYGITKFFTNNEHPGLAIKQKYLSKFWMDELYFFDEKVVYQL